MRPLQGSARATQRKGPRQGVAGPTAGRATRRPTPLPATGPCATATGTTTLLGEAVEAVGAAVVTRAHRARLEVGAGAGTPSGLPLRLELFERRPLWG